MKRVKRDLFRDLLFHGCLPMEGSCSATQLAYLSRISARVDASLIGEIGFNAGYSSYGLLSANPYVAVVSFDLNRHASATAAKKIIDERFPGRHLLVCGDSRQTVPQFARSNPTLRFDMVFIDGGHDYHTAKSDLLNMALLSSPATAVIMDDQIGWLNPGSTRAWREGLRDGVVRQDELVKDGHRAWALGRYVFGRP
jgi:predicted O-methyltransferase YrrM